MKKLLLILICLPMIGLGQIRDFEEIPEKLINNFDKMGVNDEDYLNSYESDYFNFIFQDTRGDFDFTGKKIGFVMLNSSDNSKSDYFDSEKNRFKEGATLSSAYFYSFNESEKNTTNGYDGVIAYWFKFIVDKEKLIKRLRQEK